MFTYLTYYIIHITHSVETVLNTMVVWLCIPVWHTYFAHYNHFNRNHCMYVNCM